MLSCMPRGRCCFAPKIVLLLSLLLIAMTNAGFYVCCAQSEWFAALHLNRGHLFNSMSLYDNYSTHAHDAVIYISPRYADAGRDFQWSKTRVSSSHQIVGSSSKSPAEARSSGSIAAPAHTQLSSRVE